jgi:ParB family chromosome partitioning protein
VTTAETTGLQVELLDPHDLAPHPRNVRTDLGDLTGLTDSIREQGVIEPLTVVPLNGTGYQLVAGHRRAAAAIAAGLDRVPCVIRADLATETDDSPGVAEHVATMLSENLHREGLTAAEEARGVKQMLDLGMPISKVAKRTGLGQKRVKKAIGVTRLDDESLRLVDDFGLDLDQAAAVALFPDDGEVIGRLVTAAQEGPGRFAHALEQAKRDRKLEEQFQARVAELRAAGRTVVEDFAPAGARLTRLNDSDGAWLADREAEHLSCPGSAIHLSKSWDGLHEGEVCADWKANGHSDRWASSDTGRAAKPETEEEKAAATAERRRVIENNKAMVAANTVRRAWVKELLARRSAPPEVLRFAVEEIAQRPRDFSWWLTGASAHGDKDAAEQLGLGLPERPWSAPEPRRGTLTTGEKVSDGRLPLQLLAHVAGVIEMGIGKDSWRAADDRLDGLVRWLRFLAGLGYTLSDVEQGIVDGAVK